MGNMKMIGHPEGHLWFLLGLVSFVIGMAGISNADYYYKITVLSKLNATYVFYLLVPLHHFMLFYCYRVYEHAPFPSIGRFAKSMVHLISVVPAMMLHQFDVFRLCALVGLTINLHAWARIQHVTSEFNKCDVLLGALMQVVVYTMLNISYRVSILVLVLYGTIIFYQYASYSTPPTSVCMVELLGKKLPTSAHVVEVLEKQLPN